MVQWLRLCTPGAGASESIPGQGTKIPHVMWCVQKQNNSNNKSRQPERREERERRGARGFSVALYLEIEIMKAQGVTQTLYCH